MRKMRLVFNDRSSEDLRMKHPSCSLMVFYTHHMLGPIPWRKIRGLRIRLRLTEEQMVRGPVHCQCQNCGVDVSRLVGGTAPTIGICSGAERDAGTKSIPDEEKDRCLSYTREELGAAATALIHHTVRARPSGTRSCRIWMRPYLALVSRTYVRITRA